MISFAQNFEDVLIHRFFDGESPQTYVDVGAGHPIYHSVTKHFYGLGWHGINLEPRSSLFSILEFDRPADVNLRCCASDVAGDIQFYEVCVPNGEGDNGGLSTVEPELARSYAERGFEVRASSLSVRTLSSILDQQAVHEIGFLKIDVEGHEEQVVRGMDWQKHRPRLTILESTVPMSRTPAENGISELLTKNCYRLAFFDGLNQFWVREEDEHKVPLISTPANVFDGFIPHAHIKILAERDARIAELEARLASRPLSWPNPFRRRAAA